MTTNPLKAITLTHVRYRKGDQLGHFLAWVSLIPVFISLGGFVSHFIFRRELQGMFFALGLIISQFINELIKQSVQQSRPETCTLLETCDSHGWPSSHSQYTFFFAVYFTFLTYRRIRILTGRQKLIATSIPWAVAFLTMYSRVYLGYHTVAQQLKRAHLAECSMSRTRPTYQINKSFRLITEWEWLQYSNTAELWSKKSLELNTLILELRLIAVP
ncbi:hypothetical protein NE237_009478 [Protea cynaroides]|uniref:Phosphatidic acid phosphatase type 2/haloperoxidase domain-containing protein n=1 Tax=Protea cynaroides TaxID=273540 RepID=A0A9Q0KXI6_9MAGN|nr:hypothetical protein NE237_009478 [Protea cynaroides]